MPFAKLGLSREILLALEEKGYQQPTPIQEKAIPAILLGKDVLAGAQTGTGKTAGFTLPILEKLQQTLGDTLAKGRRPVRSLILTPTRELAAQVHESIRLYGKYVKLKSQVVFGGVSINPQMMSLRGGVDILVATPGRLLDLIQQNAVSINAVEIFVLDEADRMLDMGFIHDIKKIIALLPKKRQNLLFSATYSDEIKQLANKILHSPELIEVTPRNTASELVEQKVYPVDRVRKRELLIHLIQAENWQQALVFTRTKHGANKLTEQLIAEGISAAAIHGNKSQGARTKALENFKSGNIRILVATDVAARGIDIDKLPHVVNFELPNVPEDYVHRIGRTGRAAAEGEAISLVCIDEQEFLADIEKLIKKSIPKILLSGFEPNPNIKAEPIQKAQKPNSKKSQPKLGAKPKNGNSTNNNSKTGTAQTTQKPRRKPKVKLQNMASQAKPTQHSPRKEKPKSTTKT